ncbi:unnamed protein product [Urochloa humidicola]
MEYNQKNGAMPKEQRKPGKSQVPFNFVQRLNLLGGDFEDKEPDAFVLFKLCHFSKKKKASRLMFNWLL